MHPPGNGSISPAGGIDHAGRVRLPCGTSTGVSPGHGQAGTFTEEHGNEEGRRAEERIAQVRQGRLEARRECDATPQARHAQEQQRRQGEVAQAGGRHRTVGSEVEGRQGPPSGRQPATTEALGTSLAGSGIESGRGRNDGREWYDRSGPPGNGAGRWSALHWIRGLTPIHRMPT